MNKALFSMVDLNAALIWVITVRLLNFILKRAVSVKFWESFTQSTKVSQSAGVILQLLFLCFSFFVFYGWF